MRRAAPGLSPPKRCSACRINLSASCRTIFCTIAAAAMRWSSRSSHFERISSCSRSWTTTTSARCQRNWTCSISSTIPPKTWMARIRPWGNAVLSRYPLYDARSIPNPGGGSFGVWAWSIIDGKKFMIGCVHLMRDVECEPGAPQRVKQQQIQGNHQPAQGMAGVGQAADRPRRRFQPASPRQ